MKNAGSRGGAPVARILAGGLLLCGGCMTVGPDYKPPPTPTMVNWNAGLKEGLINRQVDPERLSRWWTVLDDPVLSELMERARTGNKDLRQAEARLREARAQRGIAQADRFPTVSANASAGRTRSSKQAGAGSTTDLFSSGFDASWELDLFGGKQRTLEAAEATWQASQQDLNDVLVSLFAELALTYVDFRSYQARLSITEASLATQNETCEISRWRYEAGLTTQLDVDQALLGLEQTQAELPLLRTGLEQNRNTLAVLIGQPPGSLKDLLAGVRAIPVTPAEIAVGLPADLLRRRPDVRRAERRLAAQTAQIGVAEAARYPDFSLTGSIGLESLDIANLYKAGARTAQAAAKGAWTLFDAGRIRQNIAVQTALQEQALGAYDETVLTALKEVENALIAYANEQTRRRSLANAVEAGQRAFDMARSQYASGLVDFLTVLDTQRSLLSVQESLASSNADVTSNLIRLYKALGGGWSTTVPDARHVNTTHSGEKP